MISPWFLTKSIVAQEEGQNVLGKLSSEKYQKREIFSNIRVLETFGEEKQFSPMGHHFANGVQQHNRPDVSLSFRVEKINGIWCYCHILSEFFMEESISKNIFFSKLIVLLSSQPIIISRCVSTTNSALTWNERKVFNSKFLRVSAYPLAFISSFFPEVLHSQFNFAILKNAWLNT